MKLKVGDRVMVYGWVQMPCSPYKPRGGGAASVVWTSVDHTHIRFDAHSTGEPDPSHYEVDPKQCRKLIKKQSRRLWAFYALNDSNTPFIHMTLESAKSAHGDEIENELVEFKEVRRPKK